MSNNKCVYYKEKEQKSIDGGITWVDTGRFRKGDLVSTQASQCGSFVTEYRWTKADYVCDNGNKYNGYKQQVSHDNGGSWVDTGVVNIGSLIEENSKDCGYDEQWFAMTDKDFICDEGSKYQKMEMKYTRDSGTTWNSFDPPKYNKGHLIEENSSDCATPSMKVTYKDGTTKYFTKLKTIEKDTVSNKSNAKKVEIYDDVTGIGEEAFSGCTSLTSITIPNSVTRIGEAAFRNCESLTCVTIPNSVTSIGERAFLYCESLTSITISNSITSIGQSTFYDCRSLTGITIPDSVTRIGYGAFLYCKSLTSIAIPKGVISIGDDTFGYCYGLTSVTISNSVTSIGYMAFCYCYGLTSIIIPDSVTTIGVDAFEGCSYLESVTIGNGVKTIGHHAFQDCRSLRTMTIKATTPPTLGSDAFATSGIQRIYVPASSVNAYKSADEWKNYASKIQAIP